MRNLLAAVIIVLGIVGISRSPAYVNSGGPRCVQCREQATFLAKKSETWLSENSTDRYCYSCYWQRARAGMSDELTLLARR